MDEYADICAVGELNAALCVELSRRVILFLGLFFSENSLESLMLLINE